MSNIGKIIGYAAGYMLTVLIVGGAVLALLGFLVGWLLPLATAGALAPGFLQCIAIITLALLARIVVFASK